MRFYPGDIIRFDEDTPALVVLATKKGFLYCYDTLTNSLHCWERDNTDFLVTKAFRNEIDFEGVPESWEQVGYK